MILDTTCVICIASIFGLELLRLDIRGRNLKDIIIIQNKAKIETEAKTQVPIIKLKKTSQVVNIVMIRDCDQLRALQISKRPESTNLSCQYFIIYTTNSFSTNFRSNSFWFNIVSIYISELWSINASTIISSKTITLLQIEFVMAIGKRFRSFSFKFYDHQI